MYGFSVFKDRIEFLFGIFCDWGREKGGEGGGVGEGGKEGSVVGNFFN